MSVLPQPFPLRDEPLLKGRQDVVTLLVRHAFMIDRAEAVEVDTAGTTHVFMATP
jgi:hypothetical protein